jgi:hypothetical protein
MERDLKQTQEHRRAGRKISLLIKKGELENEKVNHLGGNGLDCYGGRNLQDR